MPSYNLPSYPTAGVTSTVTTTTSISIESMDAPAPASASWRRPPPLAIAPQRRASRFHAPPLSPNTPASIKHPFVGSWVPSPSQYRSPLAVVNSGDSDYDNQFRLAQQVAAHRSHRAPSRRYVRLPPKSASAAVQEFSILPRMLGEGGSEITRQKVYEDLVARTLERRLREKARRSVIGERAGLGVAPGREMLMMASLGSVREAHQRSTKTLLPNSAPTSAPPTRQTFGIDASPLQPDPPSAVKLQRALGHRKSASSSAILSVSSPPHRSSANQFKLGSPVSSLNTIKGFIARRAPKSSKEDLEEPTERDSTTEDSLQAEELDGNKLSYIPPSTTFNNRIVAAPIGNEHSPVDVSDARAPLSPVFEIRLPVTNENPVELPNTQTKKTDSPVAPTTQSAPPPPAQPLPLASPNPAPASTLAADITPPAIALPKAPFLSSVSTSPVSVPAPLVSISKPAPTSKPYSGLSLPSRPPPAARAAQAPMERRHSSSSASMSFPALPPPSAQARPKYGRSFSERGLGAGMSPSSSAPTMTTTATRGDYSVVRMPSPVAMEGGAGEWRSGCREPHVQGQSFGGQGGRLAFA